MMRSIAATADMSPTIRLRITATATPESMSAYAALPFEPTMPRSIPDAIRRHRAAPGCSRVPTWWECRRPGRCPRPSAWPSSRDGAARRARCRRCARAVPRTSAPRHARTSCPAREHRRAGRQGYWRTRRSAEHRTGSRGQAASPVRAAAARHRRAPVGQPAPATAGERRSAAHRRCRGARDFLAQRSCERAPSRAAHQLAEHEPERQRVVADPRARRPPWRLIGDERADPVPVTEILGRNVRPEARHAGGVHEHVAQRHAVLAVVAELEPDVGNPLLVADLATLNQHMRDRGCRAFARRRGEEQRAGGHGLPSARVGDPSNRVDDNAALVYDIDLQAVFGS